MMILLKRMKTLAAAACLTLMAGLAMHAPVMASTPDGETPANEGVCDALQGATPGLYGLCVAYCEAQDLDSFDKEPPNTKILDNYRKKMRAGDPDMPCVKVPCPCWSDEQLASISVDGVAGSCNRLDGIIRLTDNMPLTKFAEANTTAGRERCRYIDANSSPRIINAQSISPEDAQACYAAVEQACSGLGL